MIQFEHVSKCYAKGRDKALDDLTLHVGKGKVFGFIGPNGAGKTTTIKLLTGILTPTEGTVTIGGRDMAKEPLEAKRLIGFVPDSHEMYERLTGIGIPELHGGYVRCGCGRAQTAYGKVSVAV